MYATSVGLIMRGFEYLDTYKKTFNAANSDDYIQPKNLISDQIKRERAESLSETEEKAVTEKFEPTAPEEEKISLTDKIKIMLSKMFEVEDQPINK
jgi:hypothetical protein